MFQNRDQIRQVYLNVWQKLQQGQLLEPMESLIADIIELHPEYHDLLEGKETAMNMEFDADSGHSNPFLHMGMHIALREQVATDRPPGISEIHQQLCTRKGQHDAEHAMMECLGQALWMAQRDQTPPDETHYLLCLKQL